MAEKRTNELRGEDLAPIRELCLRSTYAFGKFVCGFHDFDPEVHAKMAEFEERPSRFKLGQAPRGFLKTSCWTIAGNLRRVTADPNLRVLLANEIEGNTAKWILLMQQIILSPTYRALYPDRVPDPLKVRWNTKQLELRREAKWPEPTIEGIGVGGASTSNHYDRIANDDLVGKEARESPLVMEKAIDQRKLCWSLLVDASKSEIDDYGTRWGTHDVIDWVIKNVKNVDRFFMDIQDEEGRPTWPARYPTEIITQLHEEQKTEMFMLQYRNRVVGGGASKFDPALLRYWDTTTDHEGKTAFVLETPQGSKRVKFEDCHFFQVIDAGLSPESKNARTANVVAAITPPTLTEPFDIIIVEAKATKSTPYEVVTEAHETYRKWNPMFAGIETFGGHEAFFHWIAATYPEMRIRQLEKNFSRGAKHKRIIAFWGSYPSQGRVYIHRTHTDMVDELVSYDNGPTVDLLDAAGYMPTIWVAPQLAKEKRKLPPGVTEFDLADNLDDADFVGPGQNEGRSQLTGY